MMVYSPLLLSALEADYNDDRNLCLVLTHIMDPHLR